MERAVNGISAMTRAEIKAAVAKTWTKVTAVECGRAHRRVPNKNMAKFTREWCGIDLSTPG